MKNEKHPSDKIYSTYWWIINLDPNHPKNYNPNVTEMTGYSKMDGRDEAKDKAILLMKKIIMLHSNGYFEKCKSIQFYKKKGEFVDKSDAITLFSMTKRDYKIHPDCKLNQAFYEDFFIKNGIINFLTRFYDCILNKKDVKDLLPRAKITFSKDDFYDISKHTFSTPNHLYAYCEKLIKNGHPYDAVMNFQRKYEENKPF